MKTKTTTIAFPNEVKQTPHNKLLKTQNYFCKYAAALVAATALLAACTKNNKTTSTENSFKVEVMLKTTPVKNQGSSPLCWIYGMLATLETDRLMLGDSVNLSAQFLGRKLLETETRRYFLSNAESPMLLRGTMPMALKLLATHGIQTFDSYRTKPQTNFNVLTRKLAHMAQGQRSLLTLNNRMEQLIDNEMGVLANHVFLYGAEYTPMEMGHSVYKRGDYTFLTSFLHHPQGEVFALEIPDNRWNDVFLNVSLDELMKLITTALETGHAVCWEGDTSENGFDFANGIATLDNEQPCTPTQRQSAFDKGETTDNHCMALVGVAYDRSGKKFFIAKNSWGTANKYKGYMFLSENYVRMKTIAVAMKTEVVATQY